MGGKTLKFPKRKKFIPVDKKNEEIDNPINEEEHRKRVEMLKKMGLLKE